MGRGAGYNWVEQERLYCNSLARCTYVVHAAPHHEHHHLLLLGGRGLELLEAAVPIVSERGTCGRGRGWPGARGRQLETQGQLKQGATTLETKTQACCFQDSRGQQKKARFILVAPPGAGSPSPTVKKVHFDRNAVERSIQFFFLLLFAFHPKRYERTNYTGRDVPSGHSVACSSAPSGAGEAILKLSTGVTDAIGPRRFAFDWMRHREWSLVTPPEITKTLLINCKHFSGVSLTTTTSPD